MAVTLNASTSSGLVQTADTSGTVEIQSNGTTKFTVATTGAYGQVVSGTAVASTSGTSINFTDIPSWVKRITVMFQGVSTNGVSNTIVQLGTGSTPTYATSGYTGQYNFYSQGSSSSGGSLSSGFLNVTNAAAGLSYGIYTLCNITGNTWVCSSNMSFTNSGYNTQCNGFISLAATLTAVRITMVNGTDTFDAGTINILYEG